MNVPISVLDEHPSEPWCRAGRPATVLGLVARIVLLLVSPVLVIAGVGLLASAPTVSYADGVLNLGQTPTARRDALGWHDNARNIFVMLRYESPPRSLDTPQLLQFVTAR